VASIFTKIIARELPGYFVYEDEWVVALLTIEPINPGHTLVVPKIEVNHFADVPEPHYTKVYQLAQKLAPAIQKASGCKRVGQAVIGLEVPHFHLHLIPMNSAADMNFSKASRALPEDLLEMKEKIRKYLDL
jgi:histidine triad (HIT) family protein